MPVASCTAAAGGENLVVDRGLATHYSVDEAAFRAAIEAEFGPRPSPDDLAAVDQLHTGGTRATGRLLELAQVGERDRVVDVGCGLGGAARQVAAATGATVVGIDATPGLCRLATWLTARTGLGSRVRIEEGDGLRLAPGSHDVALLMHVNMNVDRKSALFAAIRGVLPAGGRLALWEVVAGEGEVRLPAPWSATPDLSHLATGDELRVAAERAGFQFRTWEDLTDEYVVRIERARERPPRRRLPPVLELSPAPARENHYLNLRDGAIRLVMGLAVAR